MLLFVDATNLCIVRVNPVHTYCTQNLYFFLALFTKMYYLCTRF